MAQKIPFFEMFPNLTPGRELQLLLGGGWVTGLELDRQSRTMTLAMTLPAPLGELEEPLREMLRAAYGLERAALQVSVSQAAAKKEKKKNPVGQVLFGGPIKTAPQSMENLNPKMGMVTVAGRVFFADLYETRRPGVFCLTFDMTDLHTSVRVTKYLEKAEMSKVEGKIKAGMWVKVQGMVKLNRDGSDVLLDPRHINTYPHESRKDTAEVKRVELHLHTTFSNMDATTSISAKDGDNVVRRAEAWGHPAIAITDHGVAQAFPDAWHSAKEIKILYGMEGYFVNNLDDRVAVHGAGDAGFGDEYVAFDLETTGLKNQDDAIIEIGAAVIKDGQVGERFQTFVDPGRHLTPEIINLTGITDQMLQGAPQEKEALAAFLRFVDGRPLVAHNAEFDVGFVREGCRRAGLDFAPTYVDTLILAQNLLPGLSRYKLDMVAEHLQLPPFQHHRASDDAATCGLFLPHFFRMLEERGVRRLQEVNGAMLTLRPQGTANRRPRHIILIAKNKAGLKNLYQLISASNLQYFKRFPLVPKTELMKHREGLIIGSACEAGELFQAVLERKDWDELRRIASFYDFLEIQPLCNNAFLLRDGKARDEEELRDLNRTIVRLGEDLGKPVCATGDVHFLDPEDEIFRHILLDTKKFPDCDEPLPIYFKTTDEMLEEFSYLGKEKAFEVVVTNTRAIADEVERLELLPKGKLFPPRLANSEEELNRLVWDKVHALYGEDPPQLIVDRLNVELGGILGKYDVVYMSAQKLVQRSLENGYLVGSRGSVGSSLVAYMSGITEVNALPPHYRCPQCKHNEFILDGSYGCGADMPDKVCPVCGTKYVKDGFDIPFETFLGYGGGKVPDIDLNFSGEYQARAHRHAIEMFGETQVFRAGTIGTVAEKTAYGYVKKYLEARGLNPGHAEENRLALGCVGVKRTTGQHPGGLVVVPDDLDVEDFCPVQHPADAADSDIITTHFEYHCMEDNLLKLDMLGHDDPSMVRMMEDLTGVNVHDIPLDDPETMSLFTSSKGLGFENDEVLGPTGAVAIPEFNTKFTRQMLVDTQPKDFNTLVRLSGFSHGTDVWKGNARELILEGTASVTETVGCRDDIMLYLISKGLDPKMSFKIMEAVRKGKVKKGGFEEGWREAMESHGVPAWYIESLAKIGYLFPKAHAVAYVMMAFRIAWFKVHYPLAFYAAFFTIRAKAFDAELCCGGIEAVKRKLREIWNNKDASAVEQDTATTLEVCYEFYRRGFHFKTIDICRSDATKFLIEGEDGLLPPFTSVHGLGEAAAVDTVEKRAGKDFLSVEEFSDCCNKLSKTHIDQLRALGAFVGMPETSQMTLF